MLEINDLSISYGAIEVAHGVKLRVDEGRIVALIGPNGAGKTSVLRAVSGLIRPSGGDISFLGADLIGVPPHEIANMGVAHVMEGRHLFGGLTVEDNLLLASSNDETAAAGSIESVYQRWPRLRERKDQLAGTLSGGEQQMAAIGRALMTRPRFLMLDEPSWGLAPLVVQDLMKAFTRLRDEGMTILLVEQMANLALQICDYSYVMSSGRVVLEGSSQELQANPDLQATYLGGQVGKKTTMGKVPASVIPHDRKEPPGGRGLAARKGSAKEAIRPKSSGQKTVTPPIRPLFSELGKPQPLHNGEETFTERERFRQMRQRSFSPRRLQFEERQDMGEVSRENSPRNDLHSAVHHGSDAGTRNYHRSYRVDSQQEGKVEPVGKAVLPASAQRDWRSFEEKRKERQRAHVSENGNELSAGVMGFESSESETRQRLRQDGEAATKQRGAKSESVS
jgi:branched-chain amino acid transport system ATP-binding protein